MPRHDGLFRFFFYGSPIDIDCAFDIQHNTFLMSGEGMRARRVPGRHGPDAHIACDLLFRF